MLATASFDLFDTLLVRPVADPHDIFRLVERDLAAPGWARARIEAERAARAGKSTLEVDLDEIYAARPLAPWRESLPVFRAKELEWESTMEVAPEAAARVAAARAQGARILYITDMYLPRDFLLERLAPVWHPGDTLLISHEAGESKGRAWWEKLAGQYPKPWLHVGDNLRSDVLNPARHDIRTEHWTRAHPNPIELAFARDNPRDPFATGLPRLARIRRPAVSSAFWDDGADISGPVFHGFADWLLRDARQRGIGKVFFLSRDGQLPAKIAERLRATDPTFPEIAYLHGSRHAWYLAVFDPADPAHRTWQNHIPDPSIQGMFENLEMDPAEFEPSLSALGHPRSSWRIRLGFKTRQILLERLSQDPAARDSFARHRESRLRLAHDYLRSQGAFEHASVALVDIGWAGSMLVSFTRLLSTASEHPPRTFGYFFGLHQNGGEDRRAYHIHPGTWPGPVAMFPSVVEMLVPGDHGQTLGYVSTANGATVPRFASDHVADPKDIAALHAGALAYMDAAIRHNAPPPHFARALQTFLARPTSEQVARWQTFRFWTWQKPSSDTPPSLVPAFSTPALLRRVLSPWRKVDLWPWPTASIRASWPGAPDTLLDLFVFKMQIDRCGWLILHRGMGLLRTIKRTVFLRRK